MTRHVDFAPRARRDIREILDWTADHFGNEQAERYNGLIESAVAEIAQDPNQVRARSRPELHPSARTFAIRRASHIIVFRSTKPDCIEIGRVLHVSMDLLSHLPKDYLA